MDKGKGVAFRQEVTQLKLICPVIPQTTPRLYCVKRQCLGDE